MWEIIAKTSPRTGQSLFPSLSLVVSTLTAPMDSLQKTLLSVLHWSPAFLQGRGHCIWSMCHPPGGTPATPVDHVWLLPGLWLQCSVPTFPSTSLLAPPTTTVHLVPPGTHLRPAHASQEAVLPSRRFLSSPEVHRGFPRYTLSKTKSGFPGRANRSNL